MGYSQTVCFKQMKTDNNEFDPPRSKAKLIYQKQFPRKQEFLKYALGFHNRSFVHRSLYDGDLIHPFPLHEITLARSLIE